MKPKRNGSELTEYWRKHLEAWRKSGRSQAGYCRENQLPANRLTYWKKKLSAGAGLVEIPVTIESKSSIDVFIRENIRVRVDKGCDVDLLAQVIKTLELKS